MEFGAYGEELNYSCAYGDYVMNDSMKFYNGSCNYLPDYDSTCYPKENFKHSPYLIWNDQSASVFDSHQNGTGVPNTYGYNTDLETTSNFQSNAAYEEANHYAYHFTYDHEGYQLHDGYVIVSKMYHYPPQELFFAPHSLRNCVTNYNYYNFDNTTYYVNYEPHHWENDTFVFPYNNWSQNVNNYGYISQHSSFNNWRELDHGNNENADTSNENTNKNSEMDCDFTNDINLNNLGSSNHLSNMKENANCETQNVFNNNGYYTLAENGFITGFCSGDINFCKDKYNGFDNQSYVETKQPRVTDFQTTSDYKQNKAFNYYQKENMDQAVNFCSLNKGFIGSGLLKDNKSNQFCEPNSNEDIMDDRTSSFNFFANDDNYDRFYADWDDRFYTDWDNTIVK